MKYKLLGKTGLRVSELCLGTMTFGEDWGWGASKEESKKMFDTFASAGGNFIDTANHYTNGTSERFLGEFLGSDRGRYVLATKYTLSTPHGDPNAAGNHRKNLVQSLEASLKRLNTDYIDLYWVHAWDEFTPVEELMRAIDDAVRAGKILYAGVSDFPAWLISRANTLAESRGWTPFSAIQVEYSLIERTVERELLPMAKALEMSVAAWSPLGGGILTGKYTSRDRREVEGRYKDNPMAQVFINEKNLKIATEVESCARESGKSPAQIALRWLLEQEGNILPILGAKHLSQLQDNMACLDFSLSPEHRKRLDEASRIELGFPHDFLKTPFIREIVYAVMYESISHRMNPAA